MSESTTAAVQEEELPELESVEIPDAELIEFRNQQVAAGNRYFAHIRANWDKRTRVDVTGYKGPQGPAQGLLNLVPPTWVTDQAKMDAWQGGILSTVREAASILPADDEDGDQTVTVYIGSGRTKANPLGFFPQIVTEDGPNKGEQARTKSGRLIYRLNFRTRYATKRERTPAAQ